MNRRSFVMSIFGGIAAASVGGAAFAASRNTDVAMPATGEIDGSLKAALDQTDADFNQVVIRERVIRRRPRRPVVVRRRVIVRRRPPFRRRRVITRRVIVR
jgi:uncharacterized protein YcfJ